MIPAKLIITVFALIICLGFNDYASPDFSMIEKRRSNISENSF